MTVPKLKQEIAGLFWQKHYLTLEQACQVAEISSDYFLGRLKEETAKIEHNQLMKEEKMIRLSHWEWERLMALQ
ncbi:hypothetical protein PN36_27075 [Candidatus Thiomargarita nelsonii]|uniref:Uncharacterized protein n=1 Tax=Candidatus Thiomargarita nelsonii TaxID=1003181 RepID=A0A0A6RM36_9GAMM|nr:hypothetical protein PN36_27075 [Candidatus Thiomargarita nelsonii]